MRITKRTNIAMRVLMFCAVNNDRLVTKSEIAQRCNTSENHLAQVINQLAQMGVLKTQRGRNGGLRLAGPADQIEIGPIFRAMETNMPLVGCFADADNTCPLISACRLRDALSDAANAFFKRLDSVTLDFLVCNNAALERILAPESCNA